MLNCEGIAASFIEHAETGVIAQPRFQCDIENLDEDFSDVVYDPLIEDCAKKFAVLPCCDGARGYIFSPKIARRQE